jgi:hypothetical protein
MSVADKHSIPLITSAPQPEFSPEVRGGSAGIANRVPISTLQDQLRKLSELVEGAGFNKPSTSGFVVDEITINAEVSATGEIGFLVAGVEASAKGSIEIKFRRASAKD